MQLQMNQRGLRKLYRDLGAFTKQEKRALNIAIKNEGIARLRQLREQIRAGKPGGVPYRAELSKLAGRTKTGRLRKNQMPLYRLARLVRWNVEYDHTRHGTGEIRFSFGFLQQGRYKMSGRYKALVRKHQQGVDVLYTGSRTELGRRFARIGGKLKKKGDPDAKYFFLRKETGRRIRLPERQMIDPYQRRYSGDILRSIRRKWKLKLAGHWI